MLTCKILHRPLLAIALSLSCSIAVHAQKVLKATPLQNRREQALETRFSQYTVFSISAAELMHWGSQRRSETLSFTLELPGIGNWPLALAENQLISQDYTAVTAGPGGNIITGKPSCITYSGVQTGSNPGNVRLLVDNNTIYGMIGVGSELYYIEPLQYLDRQATADVYVVYRSEDVRPGSPLSCAATETQERGATVEGNNAGTNCVRVKLAIASDAGMFSRYGSAAAVQTHNIGVMNNVSGNYLNGAFADNIEFTIVTQYIAQAAASNPLTPAYAGTSITTLISNFRNWGNAGGFNQPFDLGQFWTTRDIGADDGAASVVGYAYMGALCSSYKYHILEDFQGANTAGTSPNLAAMVSHEIGHNFNLSHYDLSANIMHSSITSFNQWAPASISQMNNYIPTLSCLSPCSAAGIPVADFAMSTEAVCAGSPVQFTDRSLNGPTSWNWSFSDASQGSSTARNPVVSFLSPGTKTIRLTTTNSIGTSNTVTKTILVGAMVPAACVNGGSSASSGGIRLFSLAQINNSSGSAAEDGNKYMDYSCSKITRLLPGTNYRITISVGDMGSSTFNGHSFFIDYNNDGDFNDAGEKIWGSAFGANIGTVNLSFNTPAVPPVTGKLLRARIIAKDWVPGDDPCHNPMTGQVEDYGVFFPATTVFPLRLLDFSGTGTPQGNKLDWHTADEIQHSYFDVERSEDGLHFNAIGRVPAAVAPVGIAAYHFTDNGPDFNAAKKYYYRLRMVSTAEQSTYSAVVVLDGKTSSMNYTVFPNPFRSSFTVSLRLQNRETVSLSLSDAAGRQVFKQSMVAGQGANSMLCTPPAGLAPGIYFLQLGMGGKQYIEKIRKE